MQGKGEGKGSLCGPSQEALALIQTLPQALPPALPGSVAFQEHPAGLFSAPRSQPGENQERAQIWGQKEFVDHLFILTRYLLLAHDTSVTALGVVTWGYSWKPAGSTPMQLPFQWAGSPHCLLFVSLWARPFPFLSSSAECGP